MALTANAVTWSGTKSYTASTTISEAITVSGEVTVNVASNKTVTLKGAITGTDKITKKGLGTLLILSANSGFSGGFVIEKGYLTASNATALGSAAVTIVGQTDENSGDCCLGLWGTGKGNTNGITYANSIDITGNTTEDYPGLIVYGQGAKLTGKVTANRNFVFYDDLESTKAIYETSYTRADNVTSLTFGKIEAGGVVKHDGWTKFVFGDKLKASAFSSTAFRVSKFSATSNCRPIYEFGAQVTANAITNHTRDIIVGGEDVFNGLAYVIPANLGSAVRARIMMNGHDIKLAGIMTADQAALLDNTQACAVVNADAYSYKTLTIDGGKALGEVSPKTVVSSAVISDRINLTIDAFDGFVQVFTNRLHAMSGTMMVNCGELKITGNARFPSVPAIAVGDEGKLIIDTSWHKAFTNVSSLAVNGELKVSATATVPFSGLETLTIGANGKVDMDERTLTTKALVVDGARMCGSFTHAFFPNNIAEGTTVYAYGESLEYTDADMTVKGDWSVNVLPGCTNVVRVAQTGAGKIIKKGKGTLVLMAENSYTGGTTIEAGYVRVETNHVFGTGEIAILGQRSDYVGPCEIDIVGCPKTNGVVTYHTTITNDIHITGNSTPDYPSIVGFYNASVVSGKITADHDFCFIEDESTMYGLAQSYYDAYRLVTPLTFGVVEADGDILHDGWSSFVFNGAVTAGALHWAGFRSGSNFSSEYRFNDAVNVGAITNLSRTMTFAKTLTVAGEYYAIPWWSQNGGSLSLSGAQSIGGIMDTGALASDDTKWVYSANRISTLRISGLGEDVGPTELNTTYRFDGPLSIDLDAPDDFTQSFSNRVNGMTGTINVRSGTFKMTGTSRFAMVTGIVVAAGANFSNLTTAAKSLMLVKTLNVDGHLASPAEAFDSSTDALEVLSLGAVSELDLCGGELRVNALVVGGEGKPSGTYDAMSCPQITSGCVIALADAPTSTTRYEITDSREPWVTNVVISDSWVLANIPTGKTVTDTPTDGNGYAYWKCYVLGLTPTNAASKPIIKGVQNANPKKLAFTLGNVTYNCASGVKVKYKIKQSDTVYGPYTEVENSETNAGEVVEIDFPSDFTVKYYKIVLNYSN